MAEPAAVPGVDPSRVNTPDELAACLDGLRRRRGLSYEVMEKAAAKLPFRSGRSRPEPLTKSTVGEIVTGKRLPAKGKLLTFLEVCGVAPADLTQWLAAWERARTADLARPAGGVRVRDARPRLLGVHAAISVPGMPDDLPPEYVPRDADNGEFGVRAKVETAAQRGGFVLLIGGSSVGKTRCAFEAVKSLLSDWWLVHPAGPAEVTALAQAPPPRTVVWLDELQRYLDGEHGLTGGLIRALLTARDPVVIIGTLWPDRYHAYTALPSPGGPDPRTREREVLDPATVIRVGAEFSPAEQDRARAAAVRDPRLRVALESAGYGLTQTLAAAPQLVARWEDAQTASPYGWAVLTAALDAARLGARAPLSAGFLRAAAPGYCTSAQQAEAPDDWFEQAMDYATGKLHGAAAALNPAGVSMGRVVGYTVADYLIQHTSRKRHPARVPASTWDAILSHIRDPADAARLADSASNRLLYRYAIPLYRQAVNANDDHHAAAQLAELLARRGDLDELRTRADADDPYAAALLTHLLAERGDLNELRTRADAGDYFAAVRLADLLAERGDLDKAEQILRTWADAGVEHAAVRLAGVIARRGDLDEAEQILRTRADAGDYYAASQLAGLLARRGDLDGLRARADAGDGEAARQLAHLLIERGDLDAAEQILRTRADAVGGEAAHDLAGLLADRGDLDELRARADAGDPAAASQLAGLLARRGDLDELRTRADAGDGEAVWQLARQLADHGNLNWAVQILRARADAGDRLAASRLAYLLADLLTEQGRGEEAERLRRFGLDPDGSIACA